MNEWDDGYLQGWNDRREFERLILDATAYSLVNITQADSKLLLQIREDLTNDGKRFAEEPTNKEG
jgi:hypothetical protein